MHNVKRSQREEDALQNNEELNAVIDSASFCFSNMVLLVFNHISCQKHCFFFQELYLIAVFFINDTSLLNEARLLLVTCHILEKSAAILVGVPATAELKTA